MECGIFSGLFTAKIIFCNTKIKKIPTVKLCPQHSLKINFFIRQRLVFKLKNKSNGHITFFGANECTVSLPASIQVKAV
jgi:hypothetical protein